LSGPNDPERYAGVSIATGRAYPARQAKGDGADKKKTDTLVFHVGGWAWGYYPIP